LGNTHCTQELAQAATFFLVINGRGFTPSPARSNPMRSAGRWRHRFPAEKMPKNRRKPATDIDLCSIPVYTENVENQVPLGLFEQPQGPGTLACEHQTALRHSNAHAVTEKVTAVNLCELKALELAARSRITWDKNAWVVPSQTESGKKYRVTIGQLPTCECDDWTLHREPCKHILAARLVCERDHNGNPPPIVVDAVPRRPTYKQNWPVYSRAQQQEKDRIQVLLADLCSGAVDPALNKHAGQPRVPFSDRLFSVYLKVWSTLSSRRFNCDLEEAHRRGHLSRPLHPNKVNCFMADEELAPYLRAMIVRSALPLRAVETEFAVDSSGFSTSRFIRWFDCKHGVERREHDWVKVHLACGVKTQVVTAAAIYNKDAADSPILPELLHATKEAFTVKEMSADKGYLSVENVEAIFGAGGIPFIAPKVNTTGAAGGLFEKMFHYYQYRREEFLTHYHKRSLVESVFSAVKRKTGDSVRSKTPVAMKNEVLAKLICHNLFCVTLSQLELGIEPVFWEKDAALDDSPSILPLKRTGRA